MDFKIFLNELIGNYKEKELQLIKKALLFANEKHSGQVRKSGEPYIIHPIAVASMLVKLKADADTVCAALLHDVIEDTDTTKEEISYIFNPDIAELVDGVTKIKNNEHSSKEEKKAAYIRKVTTSILKDVRIIIIKLMDRLHNMQTLEYQNHDKQVKIAKETLDVYVPIAYYLGIYKIRFLLEDLSFKYLDLDNYKKIENMRDNIIEECNPLMLDMISLMNLELVNCNINASFEKSTKNIYGIYKRIKNGSNILDISDILRVKIIVSNLMECYQVLGIVHKLFHPVHNKFKDYISTPKTNKYQSIHTTVYTNSNYLVQLQIRTNDMNDVNQYGIINAWLNGEENSNISDYLCNNFPFLSVLKEINENYQNDMEFMGKLQHDILKDRVYITIGNGNVLELPCGYTLKDLCYKLGVDGSRLLVNNEKEDFNYVLKSNDFISFSKSKVKKK